MNIEIGQNLAGLLSTVIMVTGLVLVTYFLM